MPPYFTSAELKKTYRLINHGPATLVSAIHDGIENVMATSWFCGLDFTPAKLTVPHSYPTRSQHSPDEHLLADIACEALQIMTGLYWDLAEQGRKVMIDRQG